MTVIHSQMSEIITNYIILIVWFSLINKLVFDDAFDNEDYDEHDPEALEDPLIKIDLLVRFGSFTRLFIFYLLIVIYS